MIRTTVALDDDIFKEARKYAIDKRSAFGDLVNLALKDYLQGRRKSVKHTFEFKIYNMGKVEGHLSRSELYEDI